MLTALPDATNDLNLPCHEQRAGAATGKIPQNYRGTETGNILMRDGRNKSIVEDSEKVEHSVAPAAVSTVGSRDKTGIEFVSIDDDLFWSN